MFLQRLQRLTNFGGRMYDTTNLSSYPSPSFQCLTAFWLKVLGMHPRNPRACASHSRSTLERLNVKCYRPSKLSLGTPASNGPETP